MNGALKGSNEQPFNGQVFFIEDNMRRWMSSVDCLESYGFKWPDDVEWVSSEELSKYPNTDPMPLPWLDKSYRKKVMLEGINLRDMNGVEIGALDKPLVTKKDGNISYVDYTTKELLGQNSMYDKHVDINNIVDVDFVWGEKTLRESITNNQIFDYVLASHVIEHVPDMIGWLNEIDEILCVGGVLSLAIPDRRFTFDYFRRTTTLAEFIDAYLNRYRIPSGRQIFDHYSNAAKISINEAWDRELKKEDVEFHHSEEIALRYCRESLEQGKYIDSHCSVFTCDMFISILEQLFRLQLINFKVNLIHAPKYYMNEFIVVLEKLPPMNEIEKLEVQLNSLQYFGKASV